ncbi:SAM-dependent methyltransferase [Geomonas silvestris]|uniref:SAM-dependent methyltransferase n=1 Tax=Geomonas silvestris TaxID=2740184 RepID=A0A6V8ML30_9BACT|nr:class I SAM-dependent methyltransferase [Geomonas silvestris]GFO60682.1 SAM-dependent methyltransferase [Geomonas silvestris]
MLEKCNVCGEPLTAHFTEVRDPLTGEMFELKKCPACGLGHTVPQPEDLGPYYAGYYGGRHGFTLRYCMNRRMGFVGRAVAGKTGGRLLDIGCGDGSFLLTAKAAGWEVAGTELNPDPARQAGLEVWEAVEQLDPSRPFDCITMWHTLEHMRDLPSMMANIGKVLKPGGKLIVAVPDFGGWQAKLFKGKWLHVDAPRHLYHFDAGALKRCLKGGGFSVERAWHQEFEYDLLGWSQSALNYLMPYPNVFFEALAGKPAKHGPLVTGAGYLLGLLLTLILLPAQYAGTFFKRGGTLICVAGRPSTANPADAAGVAAQ